MKSLNYWLWAVFSAGVLAGQTSSVPLADAVKAKDLTRTRALLAQRVDVNASEKDGTTALTWAAHWDYVELAGNLLRSGAKADTPNDENDTPLWEACNNASAPMVDLLTRAGANVNIRLLDTGETALMECARTGSLDAVNILLGHGADIEAKEAHQGQTALMWAINEGHPGIAKVLIEKGADIQARSKGGFTPLLFATRVGDLATAQLLLQHGANVNDVKPAVERRIISSTAVSEGLQDYTTTQREALSALLVAIDCGHEDFAIYLVEHGANVNMADRFGYAPLHYALRNGISNLQNVGHANTNYVESFAYLFRPDMRKLVQVLLDHQANPNARVTRGSKFLSQLSGSDFPQLSLEGATPFLLAAASGDVPVMRALLAKGADPRLTTSENTTPLMAAAGVGRSAVEVRTKDEEKQSLEGIKLLLELGADVNAANVDGRTALHGAAYSGANEIVGFLVGKGAKLDAKDRYGQNALSIADGDPNGLMDDRERSSHPDTAELIRKLGGDPIKDNRNILATTPPEPSDGVRQVH